MKGSKGYFLGFLCGHILACVLTVGMLAYTFARWFMSTSPMWIGALTLVLGLLPYVAAGEIAGRRAKCIPAHPARCMLLLLGVLAAFYLLLRLLGEAGVLLSLAAMPGMISFSWVTSLGNIEYQWGYSIYEQVIEPLIYLCGILLTPLLFHLGWMIGRKSKIVDNAS